jgi:hypothetical protein
MTDSDGEFFIVEDFRESHFWSSDVLRDIAARSSAVSGGFWKKEREIREESSLSSLLLGSRDELVRSAVGTKREWRMRTERPDLIFPSIASE